MVSALSKSNPCETDTSYRKSNEPKKRYTLHHNDVIEHLQYNSHILSGYRPPLTAWQCLTSIAAYPHNELANILTHGIPGCVCTSTL